MNGEHNLLLVFFSHDSDGRDSSLMMVKIVMITRAPRIISLASPEDGEERNAFYYYHKHFSRDQKE